MRGGQRVLDTVAWVRLWSELAVLAHLTGWPMPVPTPGAIAALRAQPTRLAQCAASQAIDAAVAARPGIARPSALAAHVAAGIRARAERSAWLCLPDEPEWMLGAEMTGDAVFGVARPSALEAEGILDSLAATFIDCHWASFYLSGGRPGIPPGDA
jgi:hypothetical protein